MYIKSRNLKPGDKVNFHEYGWETVLSVKRHGYDGTKVLVDGQNGKREIIFYPRFDRLEFICEGIYTI